jgi:hypothetical protein
LASRCRGRGNIDPLGITGTPVIDQAGGSLYLNAMIGAHDTARTRIVIRIVLLLSDIRRFPAGSSRARPRTAPPEAEDGLTNAGADSVADARTGKNGRRVLVSFPALRA